MPDVVEMITDSRVIVRSRSRELFRELALQNLLGKRGVVDLHNRKGRSAIELQLCLLDPSLDQLIESSNGSLFASTSGGSGRQRSKHEVSC